MNKISQIILLSFLFIIAPLNSYFWGKNGHTIVAEIAFTKLDNNTKEKILFYLDGMSLGDAANWMDNLRDQRAYDYMKPYHYVNFDKGGVVVDDKSGKNIISVLNNTIAELHNYKSYSREEVKLKLLMVIHLVGDLHQPLHVGYGIDKGGNTYQVNYNGKNTNLHSIMDSKIINAKNITVDDCVNHKKYSNRQIKKIQKINVVKWAEQSRSNLDVIYSIKGHKVTDDYVVKVEPIIKDQIYKGGLRLASVLEYAFNH